jgi:flagellar biosynthesis/type III secretory pathway chaperone
VSAVVVESDSGVALETEVLAHLNTQLESARRLQGLVHEQSTAIRAREVVRIVQLAAALQVEIDRRELIELERVRIMERAAVVLGVPVAEVTVGRLASLMDEGAAFVARARSQELRAMLKRIQREHKTNRALMRQRLAFLDHLLRLAGGSGSYDADGDHSSARRTRALTRRPLFDLEA